MTEELEQRVRTLESAVLALAAEQDIELGDSPGHDFRGNQYSGGGKDYRPQGTRGHGTNHSREEHARRERLRKMQKEARQEFGDLPGHDFHGNQWTARGGSDKYTLHVGPHPYREGMVHVRLDEKGGEVGRDSRTVKPGEEEKGVSDLLRLYSKDAEHQLEQEQAAHRDKVMAMTKDEISSEVESVNSRLQEQGYDIHSIDDRRIQRAVEEAKTDPWLQTTIKPPSGYEIGAVSLPAIQEIARQRR